MGLDMGVLSCMERFVVVGDCIDTEENIFTMTEPPKRIVLGNSLYRVHGFFRDHKGKIHRDRIEVSRMMICTNLPYEFTGEKMRLAWPLKEGYPGEEGPF